MHFETLLTERLKLRKLTPEVFTYVFENFSDYEIKTFFDINSDLELKKEKEKYKKGISTFNKTFLYFQLIDKITENIIGWCGYHTWYLDHKRAEIGYTLTNDDFKEKGIMTEAIFSIIEYGFKKMDLNRIEAYIEPANIPSLKIIKNLNFKQEGYLREHYRKNNVVEDSLVFSLLKNEYENQKTII